MLNIKDPEAHRLARELAEAEGITLTEAVIRSLRAALEETREHRRRVREVLAGEIAAARTGEQIADPFAELYDPETGLPA